ncbi:MAG TPA: heparan-alpha-glucosaminide N-acetyltransferase domain-containing protein, partial [Gemmatimonadales bacterium]|nr:heparan-alpha-glucosaminide N-acetyltransferase domain-containing protein [Gemmatimonadales bacterium]
MSQQQPIRPRVEPVDVLRGLIMIIMALDHTRDYFGDFTVDPTAIATTTPGLFFTRWITHFCAPVFFLLTGTGAFLSLQRKTKDQLGH